MKAMRLWAIARKEFIHVFRDPRSLAMAIAIPILLLVLFGYALTLDVDKVPLVVWDQDGSPASRELVSRFSGSRYFLLRGYESDYAGLDRSIDTRRALMAVVIPRGFAGRIESGRPGEVQLIVDGSDSNTATIALGYANAVARDYSQEVTVRELRRRGLPGVTMPVDLRPRVWFNEELQSKNYVIPGLIAVIMMIIAALLTSLTVAREWERGTMEQLISTPVKGPELVLGKLLPYFTIGMLDVLLAVTMGELVFHVPLRGSVILVFFVAAIFLIGTLSLGMLISIVTRNQLLSTQLAMVLTFLPSFLLSGFVYTVSNMPKPIQIVAYFIPAKYFVAILKGIYLKGVGLKFLALEIGLLVAFAVAALAAANLVFRKRLS